MFTDASNYAAAGVLLHVENHVVHVMFTNHEKQQRSTFRELKAVELALKSLSSKLDRKHVKLYTDNQNVVRIINTGSMKTDLQKIAFSIFELCVKSCIFLDVAWIPRSLSIEADLYSKVFDFDDWEVSEWVFKLFDKMWGPHTFDRFANSKNCKVEKFNSQYWTPGTSGVDAFVYDWSSDNNWLVPPVHCIPNLLKHLLFYKCVGTLVVPKWKSALFWPCIALEHKFKWFVKDVLEYVKPKRFFSEGWHKESVFARSPSMSNVLVLKIDCR